MIFLQEITDLSLNIQCIGQVYEFDPVADKLHFDKIIMNMTNFRINIKMKSMLSTTPCKKCCIGRWVGSII